jgi:hypothetical protein
MKAAAGFASGLVFVPTLALGAGPATRVYYAGEERVVVELVPELLSVGFGAAASGEAVRHAVALGSGAEVTRLGDGMWRVVLAPRPARASSGAALGEPNAALAQPGSEKADRERVALAAETALARQQEVLARALSDPGIDWAYPVYREPRSGALLFPTPRVILAVADDVDEERLRSLLPDSVRILRPLRAEHQYLLELAWPRRDDPLAVAVALVEDHAWVRWAEPDFVQSWKRDLVPDDPLFPNQWHLSNTGQSGGVVGADARLEGAWDLETGNGSVVVAVLDDGVQIGHPDIPIFTNPDETPDGADNDGNGLVDDLRGWDFFSDDNDPDPCASATCSAGVGSHGTAVAGVAAATGDNATGVTGACQNCQILPIRIASHETGAFASNATIADAIGYAGEMADVLNNSWGGGSVSAAITTAIQTAASSGRGGLGSPVFFSTGNSASGYIRYFSLGGFEPGTWTFTWTFQKDAFVSAGFDTAWLDTVIFPGGMLESFETCTALPAGWSSSGDADWQPVEDETRADSTFGGGCAIRAGDVGDDESSSVSVTKVLESAGILTYAAWPSAEAVTATGEGPLVVDDFSGLPECFDYLQLTVSDGTNSYGPFHRTCGTFSNQGNPLQDGVVSFPASVTAAIAAGAATNFDTRAGYSQWGEAVDLVCHSNGGNLSITTTDLTGANGYAATDYTATFGGTSSASPLCAGVAALALSGSPSLTEAELRTLLQDHARKIGTLSYTGGRNDVYGFGAVDAETALSSLTEAGTIVIEKATIPDGEPTTFTFGGALAGAIADGQQLSASVAPGSYSASEVVPAGWSLLDIECDDGDSVGDVEDATAMFQVAPAETVTCVFTNCDAAVELSGLTVTEDETFESCGSITAEDFVVDPGARVDFHAAVSIALRSGFRVAGSFSAVITGTG